MSERLSERYFDPKWTVVKCRDLPVWSVFGPNRYAGDFPTHAEAITYADAQARKES